jgi:hypothetical protein
MPSDPSRLVTWTISPIRIDNGVIWSISKGAAGNRDNLPSVREALDAAYNEAAAARMALVHAFPFGDDIVVIMERQAPQL